MSRNCVANARLRYNFSAYDTSFLRAIRRLRPARHNCFFGLPVTTCARQKSRGAVVSRIGSRAKQSTNLAARNDFVAKNIRETDIEYSKFQHHNARFIENNRVAHQFAIGEI